MRKLHPDWGRDEIIAYNLRNGGTEVSIFADTQTGRVATARDMVGRVLEYLDIEGRATIVEPGCSAGDISGIFSEDHDVWGCDVVPAAVAATRERYPFMAVEEAIAEDLAPRPCDVLVLCEFLEHIERPVEFVQAWMPLARGVVIGHPLVGDGYDPEVGHVWAYYPADFVSWFELGGHRLIQAVGFDMGYEMTMGWGVRR